MSNLDNIERTTELSRDKMHSTIKQCSNLTDSNVVKASQELDQKILTEMVRQDPKIENIYLKRVIKAKDEQIRTLQNKLYEEEKKQHRIKDIVEVAVMKYESGMMAINSIDMAVRQAKKEGLI